LRPNFKDLIVKISLFLFGECLVNIPMSNPSKLYT